MGAIGARARAGAPGEGIGRAGEDGGFARVTVHRTRVFEPLVVE